AGRSNVWRREWDSNPRYGLTYTRFPSVRLKPLGHLSALALAKMRNRASNGGEGGIRTPDTREGITVFETAALNHSATSPFGCAGSGRIAEADRAIAVPRTPPQLRDDGSVADPVRGCRGSRRIRLSDRRRRR